MFAGHYDKSGKVFFAGPFGCMARLRVVMETMTPCMGAKLPVLVLYSRGQGDIWCPAEPCGDGLSILSERNKYHIRSWWAAKESRNLES